MKMACAKIGRNKINSDLLLHMHNCLFVIPQVAEDELEAQPRRTHVRLGLVGEEVTQGGSGLCFPPFIDIESGFVQQP